MKPFEPLAHAAAIARASNRAGDTTAVPGRDPLAPSRIVADAVVVLVLADFAPGSRLWGFMRLVLQRWPLRGIDGLRFAKVLGSGHDAGFGVRPSLSHHGLFLVFEGEAPARRFVDSAALLTAYPERSRELCVAFLRACSSKGSWSGVALQPSAAAPATGPIASLTRASIRPSRLLPFWRLSPAAERSLAAAPGCRLAVGLGEAPLLRQCTFSLWDDAAAMSAYARSGAHGEAIRAAYGGAYFSEAMFVRFVPLLVRGRWKGVDHAG